MTAPQLEIFGRNAPARRPLGPWPVEPSINGVRVPVRDRRGFYNCGAWAWVILSPEDYRLGMSRPWFTDRCGYVASVVSRESDGRPRRVALHRLVARAPEGVVVDHQRHDLLDCRRGELRWATASGNAANTRRRQHPTYTTIPFRGVTFHKNTGRYQASAHYMGRCIYLGLHNTSEAAARAYDKKARELWGSFAQLNFPAEGEQAAARDAA